MRTVVLAVLVAIATSLIAAPILRLAMARVEYTAEERLRELEFEGAGESEFEGEIEGGWRSAAAGAGVVVAAMRQDSAWTAAAGTRRSPMST